MLVVAAIKDILEVVKTWHNHGLVNGVMLFRAQTHRLGTVINGDGRSCRDADGTQETVRRRRHKPYLSLEPVDSVRHSL